MQNTRNMVQNGAQKWGSGTTCHKNLGTALARETASLEAVLPKGVSLGQWTDGRGKPFYVRYGDPRKMESFTTEGERNLRTQAILEYEYQEIRYEPEEWTEWLKFRKETGATIADLRKLWEQVRGRVNLNLAIAEAVSRYLRLRSNEGLAEDSLRHMKTILGRFTLRYGHLQVTALTADHLRDWLSDLTEANHFQSVTLRHHRKEVSTFYARAIREKWAIENPCAAVIPPKIQSEEDISVLSLKDAFSLFKANVGQPIIGKLALEAFAGLRLSSAARIALSEIHHEEHGITFPAAKHKLRERHFIDGLPENLFEWLKVTPASCWEIMPRNYNKLKGEAFIRAGVVNPGNVLRHSFCTFHLAAYHDVSRTATILTHRNTTMLYQHYKGRGVGKNQGLAYFQITPQTVKMGFEQFLANYAQPNQRPVPQNPQRPR